MMKKLAVSILCALVLTAAASHALQAEKRGPGAERSHVRGRVIVKFRADAPEMEKRRARSLVSGRQGRRFRHVGIETVRLTPGFDEETAVELLMQDPYVEYAELDRRVEWLSAPLIFASMSTFVPGEPLIGQQWHLRSDPVAGWAATPGNALGIDVDIDAPEGWAVLPAILGSVGAVSVGVIDSGCGESGFFSDTDGYIPNHTDLPAEIVYTKQSELSGVKNSDDDGNGLIDDVSGYDWFTSDDDIDAEKKSHTYEPDDNIFGEDNEPADAFTGDKLHGTLISGILAGAWNGTGIAGVGYGSLKVVPLRAVVLSDIVEAFDYAIGTVGGADAVRVINASWKFTGSFQSLEDAVRAAQGKGIAVVASAGNDSNLFAPYDSAGAYSGIPRIANNDDYVSRVFPAEYTRSSGIRNVLTVAATGKTGSFSDFSNVGPSSVQIAAPGETIWSTGGGTGGYGWADGTSFSAPITAAVLGLVMAAHPGMAPEEAIDRVVEGGDFDDRLAGLVRSGRRVNLAGALAPFAPWSGLVYLDGSAVISMYGDSVSSGYGDILSAGVDTSRSTSPVAASVTGAPSSTLTITPLEPGVAQFTLFFDTGSAPVATYDTGPWRVTAIKPFSPQVRIGSNVTFTSLLPALAGTVSWSVLDSSVATITSGGTLTGRSAGITRVVLSAGGVEKDYSGMILVQSSSAFKRPSSGGGCGTTFQPGDPYLPGLVEMMLMGLMLLAMRMWWQRYRIGNPEFERG